MVHQVSDEFAETGWAIEVGYVFAWRILRHLHVFHFRDGGEDFGRGSVAALEL
jgi:hypothetical protein